MKVLSFRKLLKLFLKDLKTTTASLDLLNTERPSEIEEEIEETSTTTESALKSLFKLVYAFCYKH